MNTKPSFSVKGIGSDLIEIDRIEQGIAEHGGHFKKRLFTQNEQDYCEKHAHSHVRYAGRFCAKEAIAKALGVGFGELLAWTDLEILNDEKGKPVVHCSHALNQRFNNPQFLLTITHSRTHAHATALWVDPR